MAQLERIVVDVGADDHIIGPDGNSRHRKTGRKRGGIAPPNGKRTDMRDRTERDVIGAERRRRRQVDLVDPARRVRRHGAVVGDGPGDIDGRRDIGLRRHLRDGRHQVGIGLDDVERGRNEGAVGARVRFRDRLVEVADHGKFVRAGDPGRNLYHDVLRVTRAYREGAGLRIVAEHDILRAGTCVHRNQDQAIDPGSRRGRVTGVLDGPADRGRIAGTGTDGHAQAIDGQAACSEVGVSMFGGRKCPGRRHRGRQGRPGAVDFEHAGSAAGLAVSCDRDHKVTRAGQPGREIELHGALHTGTRRERHPCRRGECHGCIEHDRTQATVGIFPPHRNAILVARGNRHAALVDVIPHDRDAVAVLRRRLQESDVLRDNGRSHHQLLRGRVVAADGALGIVFGDLVRRIHRDDELEGSDAVQACGPGEAGRARRLRARRNILIRKVLAHVGNDRPGDGVDQLHALGPIADRVRRAVVGGIPVDRHVFARLPPAGRREAQAGHLQIR